MKKSVKYSSACLLSHENTEGWAPRASPCLEKTSHSPESPQAVGRPARADPLAHLDILQFTFLSVQRLESDAVTDLTPRNSSEETAAVLLEDRLSGYITFQIGTAM
ncbi:hypothetical protein J6590_073530 [Homalodisca vitripennis]|nr:hypothetical protein J6590_073530 [Homalodisca vitripennis]